MIIIKIEPISVGNRLKDLIEEQTISKKEFVRQFNQWLENQQENGKYIEQPKLTEKDLSRWTKGRVNMRQDKIEMFANFFGVDVNYLACTQLDKHKPDLNKYDNQINLEQLRKAVEEIEKKKPWLQLLKEKGYVLKTIPITWNTEEFQFLDDGQIITAVDSIGEDPETYITDPEGNCYLYDDGLINDLDAYLRFRVSQLKPYDNNSSGS